MEVQYPLWRISTLFERSVAFMAFLGLVSSFFLPKQGLVDSMCPTYHMTGRPCPFCGLTRSVTCLSHFDFSRSLHYHGLGWIFYIGMVLLAVFFWLPQKGREEVIRWFVTHRRLDSTVSIIFWTLVFGFGVARFIWWP